MFHLPGGADSLDFVELTNPGENERSLAGFALAGDVSFSFPTNMIIDGFERVLVAHDSAAIFRQFGVPAFQYEGHLPNNGGTLWLLGPGGIPADSIEYDDQFIWPTAAHGNGTSMVKCIDTVSSSDPFNWSPSADPTGVTVNGYHIMASPAAPCDRISSIGQVPQPEPFSVFPNPSTGRISLRGIERSEPLEIINMQGMSVTNIPARAAEMTVDLSTLNAGIYVIRNGYRSKRLMLLK